MSEIGLRVRPWSPADAPALVSAWCDDEVARWNKVPDDASIDAARRWIEGTARQHALSPSRDFVLVDDSDDVVGEIGFRIDHEKRRAEVGFWLGATHRGRGLGEELLDEVGRLTDQLALRQVFAVTSVDNAAANALLDSAGWREVATTTADRRAFVLES